MAEKDKIPAKQNQGIGKGAILLIAFLAIAAIAGIGLFVFKSLSGGVMPSSSSGLSSTNDTTTTDVTQPQKSAQMEGSSLNPVTTQQRSAQMQGIKATVSTQKDSLMGSSSSDLNTAAKMGGNMSSTSNKALKMGDTGIDYIENCFGNNKWGPVKGNIILNGVTR